VQLPKSMMLFLKLLMMVQILLKNLVVVNWYNKNLMLLLSQMVESEILSKLVDIPLGIQLLQHLSSEQHLCIPTVFISYTGEALDYKTPLLSALNAVDEAATDVCKYFDKNVKKVTATLGWEQEYFLGR
jgi:hypothetical protein